MKAKFDEILLTKGNLVTYHGDIYEIVRPYSLNEMVVKNVKTEEQIIAKINELQSAKNNEEGAADAISASDLLFIKDACWAEAKKREKLISPYASQECSSGEAIKIASKLRISKRQVYNLIKKYRNSGKKLTSLLPPAPSGGKNKSRLARVLDDLICSIMQKMYLTKQQYKASVIVQEIKKQCQKLSLKPPSKNTIRERIARLNEYQKFRKREGKSKANKFTPIKGNFNLPIAPLEIVQIDHTKVDLIVVDEIYRQPIGRPYLTVAIDEFSRCITGFCLTLDAPSAVSVGLCLAHSVFDKESWLIQRNIKTEWAVWGKPKTIYVDNAREFHSEALERGCDMHGIDIKYRPIGSPHYGGIVERLIGTLMQLIHQLPGTTFSNIQDRKGYDSEERAVLTLAELEHWLTIAITDYYHQKFHEGIRMSPLEKYKQGILGDDLHKGLGYPSKIDNKKAFLIDFLPIERRTLQRDGFTLDHITYYGNHLSPLIADRTKYGKLIIRRDPRDLSKVYVLDPLSKNNYLEVFYRTLMRPTITLWEHRQALKYLKKKGHQFIDEDLVFKAVDKMRNIAKESAKKTKTARKAVAGIPKSDADFLHVTDKSKNTPPETVRGITERYEDIEIWK